MMELNTGVNRLVERDTNTREKSEIPVYPSGSLVATLSGIRPCVL